MNSNRCLYTIGHSDHDMEAFGELLARHEIRAVVDVRSYPYSRLHNQYNRDVLEAALKARGLGYLFLGNELGARRSERESYSGNQARYDLIAQLPAYKAGLERVRRSLSLQRIALLCAEKDPITCHRMVLVCRHLRSNPIEIRHILYDGSTESTEQAEARLLDAAGLPESDLFRSREDMIECAYDYQAERIAYSEASVPDPDGVNV